MDAFVVIICLSTMTFVSATDSPIIGILSQEMFSIAKYFPGENYESFIAASYVKFVESAGGRVVPIRIGRDRSYYVDIINNTNGILFPGGATWFNETGGYGEVGQTLYDLALETNQKGVYYPVFGICLGMELLGQVAIGGQEIRAHCSASKLPLALNFEDGYNTSKLFSKAPPEILKILATEPVTYNSHQYCFTKDNFTRYGLSDNWKILATNKDRNGLEFISAFESDDYPFYGIQFHPEKNQFEFVRNYNIPHSLNAVKVAQYFANFFLEEARRNEHGFEDRQEERDALIYNYNPVFTGARNSTYEQVYVFGADADRVELEIV